MTSDDMQACPLLALGGHSATTNQMCAFGVRVDIIQKCRSINEPLHNVHVNTDPCR